MLSSLINVGNSKAVILPDLLLEECGIGDQVNIEIHGRVIVIAATNIDKRKGWAEAFKNMSKNGDDQLMIPDVFDDEHI